MFKHNDKPSRPRMQRRRMETDSRNDECGTSSTCELKAKEHHHRGGRCHDTAHGGGSGGGDPAEMGSTATAEFARAMDFISKLAFFSAVVACVIGFLIVAADRQSVGARAQLRPPDHIIVHFFPKPLGVEGRNEQRNRRLHNNPVQGRWLKLSIFFSFQSNNDDRTFMNQPPASPSGSIASSPPINQVGSTPPPHRYCTIGWQHEDAAAVPPAAADKQHSTADSPITFIIKPQAAAAAAVKPKRTPSSKPRRRTIRRWTPEVRKQRSMADPKCDRPPNFLKNRSFLLSFFLLVTHTRDAHT